MSELNKGYESKDVEAKRYEWWMDKGLFKAADKSEKPPYSIVIPPPNVTGALHMGHALTFTIQDMLIRWRRMQGYNTLWLPGTDHAGIATQMVVERELAKSDISRFDLGREGFLKEVWKWKEQYHDRIVGQMKAMGVSVDWDRERFTLDDGLSRAVRRVFVDMYKEGLIYRDLRMVNWSPGIQTVLSDLEVDQRETQGHLWYMAYPVEGSDERVIVATTRPETMLGDTGVMVHPEDPRYKHLIGKFCVLPLANRRIPIFADEAVELEFGTGAVKVTPAHDFTDFEVGKRHNLDVISIFDKDARFNANVPEKYQGLDRFEARERIVADLDDLGLLEKIEDYTVALGYCQRSGSVVEPMVSKQWFVRTKELAAAAVDAVKDGRTEFIPKHWEKTYFHWMEDIRDWCISRQLWWGHRIPVWYCQTDGCEEFYVGEEAPPKGYKCPKCGGTDFVQDQDVLDTWFSSGLWPFSTLGWPEDTDALRTFYPTTVMETGFDIIFFWVARMMMMGLHFMKDVPFKTVYLHAMVRDEKGDKMSKVKGNVIDPLVVINEYGTDALRFTLATMTAQGRDIKMSVSRVSGYKAFMNKLWNAARFIFMNLDDAKNDDAKKYPVDMDALLKQPLAMADRWILNRLRVTLKETNEAMEAFRFNDAANRLYQFTWHEFCDWYIELSKGALYAEGQAGEVAKNVLITVLHYTLRALHPIIPFITEELWQHLAGFTGDGAESIMTAAYPDGQALPEFVAEDREMDLVIAVITAIRNIKAETGMAPGEKVDCAIKPADAKVADTLSGHAGYIQRLARLKTIDVDTDMRRPPYSAFAVAAQGIEVFVPMGKERLEKEAARLKKAMDATQKELDKVKNKLANPKFISRAPRAIIEKQEGIREELLQKLDALKKAMEAMGL